MKKLAKINLKELSKFLVEAKRNTYAGGRKAKRLADGSKELIFKKGNLKYKDRYFGSNPFIGEEIVWYNGKAIWGMNYYGKIIHTNTLPQKEIYNFLRKALRNVKESAPFRGPLLFKEGDLEYINKFEGTIIDFKGEEGIFRVPKSKIYTLQYEGGFIEKQI